MFISGLTLAMLMAYTRAFLPRYAFSMCKDVKKHGGSNIMVLHGLCIDRPIEKDTDKTVPKMSNDLSRISKRFYYRRVGNGTDDRKSPIPYEKESVVAHIRENMYKLSIIRQLEDDTLSIHHKLALYKLYETEHIPTSYEPNLAAGDLFKDWI
jgi:hypothetical protein